MIGLVPHLTGIGTPAARVDACQTYLDLDTLVNQCGWQRSNLIVWRATHGINLLTQYKQLAFLYPHLMTVKSHN